MEEKAVKVNFIGKGLKTGFSHIPTGMLSCFYGVSRLTETDTKTYIK